MIDIDGNRVIADDFELKGRFSRDSLRGETKNGRALLSIGIVSGEFAPLHVGHLALIGKARRECDVAIVVVGGSAWDRAERWRSGKMTLKRRYQRLRVQFNELERRREKAKRDRLAPVYAAMIEEAPYSAFDDPTSLSRWRRCIEEVVIPAYVSPDALAAGCAVRNYVGDAAYVPVLESAYPDWETVLFRRDDADGGYEHACVSATAIRSNPDAHWDWIAPSFRCFFRHLVVVSGAMSVGKTTMTEHLAKRFGAAAVLEYARVWTSGWRHAIESDLGDRDYLAFIHGQLAEMEDALYDCGEDRLVIADTDAVSTLIYIQMAREKVSAARRPALECVCRIGCEWVARHADAVLLLPPDTEYVYDGSRDGHFADRRDEYTGRLLTAYSKIGFGARVKMVARGDYAQKTAECDRYVAEVLGMRR